MILLKLVVLMQLLGAFSGLASPEEIACLRSGIYLGLPRILALAQDCRSHDLVAVFPTYQIRSLEEYSRFVGKGQSFPS